MIILKLIKRLLIDIKRSPRRIKKYFSGWRGAINGLEILANLANAAGIGSHIIIALVPIGKALLESVFSVLTFYADPLIYFLRAFIRVTRLMGRFFSKKPNFEEETYGVHPQQNTVDIIATGVFLLVVGLFFVPHSVFALQAGLAWFLGLAGTLLTVYFDHYYPSVQAAVEFKRDSQKSVAEEYSNQKYYSTRLYLALIFFMLLLLVVGSIPTWGFSLSATAILGLEVTAKIGAVSLAVINVARPINAIWPRFFNRTLGCLKSIVCCCFSRKTIEDEGNRVDLHIKGSHARHMSVLLPENKSPKIKNAANGGDTVDLVHKKGEVRYDFKTGVNQGCSIKNNRRYKISPSNIVLSN